ncbi:hypothetical protein [Nonomuraea basaltis]|uniref:hypothetical protein n=1 Tax=Nonomuraea basaltis TaxID=2495887 RepID=UPI00110C64E2|nr:hypothetical protein [Nonomuraea basaltis]TMR99579.1 hypothetical protein EJK15_07130 [Nonomuraea basaltis]
MDVTAVVGRGLGERGSDRRQLERGGPSDEQALELVEQLDRIAVHVGQVLQREGGWEAEVADAAQHVSGPNPCARVAARHVGRDREPAPFAQVPKLAQHGQVGVIAGVGSGERAIVDAELPTFLHHVALGWAGDRAEPARADVLADRLG